MTLQNVCREEKARTPNRLTESACFLLIPSPPIIFHPGAQVVKETSQVTAVLTDSNKCDQAARGPVDVGGFDTPSSLGPPKV